MMRFRSTRRSPGRARDRRRPCRARCPRSARRARGRTRPRTSSSEPTPPEAITGIAHRARERLRWRRGSGPSPVPSRAMSVWISAATPASSKRRASVSASVSLVSSQPETATRPSRASMPDRDAAREAARGAPHQLGVAQRGGAEHDAVRRRARATPRRGERADAAAELERHALRGREDRAHRVGVAGPAELRAVEVHHVEAAERVRGEARGDRGRVGVVDGRGVVAALHEPHAVAAEQVDRGDQLEGGHGITARAGAPRPARSRRTARTPRP